MVDEEIAYGTGKDSWQLAAGRKQRTEDRSQESEERDSPVGAAFSRDLAI
jgi:hypothetical protein